MNGREKTWDSEQEGAQSWEEGEISINKEKKKKKQTQGIWLGPNMDGIGNVQSLAGVLSILQLLM